MKSYLVVVSESMRKEYVVQAKSEQDARENYKDARSKIARPLRNL